jgi:Arc/MetJ-type ribon-helix-helix transcriptional regulator
MQATVRCQLHLTQKSADRLERLVKRTDSSSMSEVMRNALRLYEALIDETEKGASVILEKANGERVSVFAPELIAEKA